MKERFSLLWEGFVMGKQCGSCINFTSERQLRQWSRSYENDPCVDSYVLWDREEGRVSYTVDPIDWEDKPTGFEEEWEAVL